MGFLLGLDRMTAARFSFLAAIPAIAAAAAVDCRPLLESTATASPALGWGTLAAAVVAGVVGYHAIAVVFRLLRHLTLHRFSYYVWALGAVLLVAGVMSR